ncbi:MAG: OmpP1/FadL family transporter [Cetobacterium sp.]|uniref:OmpP1/FadL family transporter n=1 Tax=Cetobacterium sp. TaxID=2071632 RepID=UPI003EE74AD1
MKKYMLFFLAHSLAFGLGGIEIGTSQSPRAVANPAQTATISTESPFYNPAASSFLDTGDYVYFGLLGVFPKYTIKYEGKTVAKTTTTQPLPSFTYIKNQEKIGYFIAAGSLGQGGFLKYNVAYDRIKNLDITAFNPGVITGVSYKFKNDLSAAFSLRMLYSKMEAKGRIDTGQGVHSDIKAFGIAPEISVFYKYNENLDLGAKFLFRTKLDYDGQIKTDDGNIANTILAKFSRDHKKDFPSVLSLGLGYNLTDKDRLSLGYNAIFERDKEFAEDLYSKYKNTYEYLFGYERILNEKFKWMLGYGYIDKGRNDHPVADMTQLSCHQISTGIKYKYSETINITASLGGNFYKSNTSNLLKYEIETTRREILFGVAFEKKF